MGNCVSGSEEKPTAQKSAPSASKPEEAVEKPEEQKQEDAVANTDGVTVELQAQARGDIEDAGGELTGATSEAVNKSASQAAGEVAEAVQDGAAAEQGHLQESADEGKKEGAAAHTGQDTEAKTSEIEAAPEGPKSNRASKTGERDVEGIPKAASFKSPTLPTLSTSTSLTNRAKGNNTVASSQVQKPAGLSRIQSSRTPAVSKPKPAMQRSSSTAHRPKPPADVPQPAGAQQGMEDGRTAEQRHLDAVKAKAAENVAKAKELAEAKAAESRAAVQREKEEKAAKLEAERIKAAELKAAGEKAARDARAAEEARLEAKAKAAKAKAEAKEQEAKAAAEQRAAEYRAAKEKAEAEAEAERQQQAEEFKAVRARERAQGPDKVEITSRYHQVDSYKAAATKGMEPGAHKGLLRAGSGTWLPGGAMAREGPKPAWGRTASHHVMSMSVGGGGGRAGALMFSRAASSRAAPSYATASKRYAGKHEEKVVEAKDESAEEAQVAPPAVSYAAVVAGGKDADGGSNAGEGVQEEVAEAAPEKEEASAKGEM